MTPIRVSYPTAGSVLWSDGSAFNGFALIGIKALVDGSSAAWPSISRGNSYVRRVLPQWVQLPIREGAFVGSPCGVPYNADINPPGSQYVAWYYDTNGKKIAGPTSAFIVSATTFSVPTATLTVPTVGSSPTPDS